MATLNFTGSPGQNLTGPGGATDLALLAGAHANGKIGPFQPGTDGGFGTAGPYATAVNTVAVAQVMGAPVAPSTQHNSLVTRIGPATHYDPLQVACVLCSADGLTRYELVQRIWGQFELRRVIAGVVTSLEYYNTYADKFGLIVAGTGGASVALTVYLDGVLHPRPDADAERIVAAGVPGLGWIGSATATPDRGGLYFISWESDVYGASAPVNEPPVVSISNPPGDVSLSIGSTLQFAAEVEDTEDNPDPEVSWSTSNAGVSTVTSSGLVTAVSAGEATITAEAEDADGATHSESRKVTVTSRVVIYHALAVVGSSRSGISNKKNVQV